MSEHKPDHKPEHKNLDHYQTLKERKHLIRRYKREIGGEVFYVAEVWSPKATKPDVSVLRRIDVGTLADVTTEAQHYVKVLIANHGKIPAGDIKADMVFDDSDGLDGLNVRSASGKAQWCDRHWALVRGGMIGQTHNGIVAGLLLTSVFVEKIKADGILTPGQTDVDKPYVMELLRDSYSPFCCWLGEETVDQILFASRVEEVEKSGVLKMLEAQLLKRKK